MAARANVIRETSDTRHGKDVYYVIMIQAAGFPSECKRWMEGGGACSIKAVVEREWSI